MASLRRPEKMTAELFLAFISSKILLSLLSFTTPKGVVVNDSRQQNCCHS